MGRKDRATYHKINDVLKRLERGVFDLKGLFISAPEVKIDPFLEANIGDWQEYAEGVSGRVLSKFRAVVFEGHYAKGCVLPEHYHAFDEYVTVLKGSLFEHRAQRKYEPGKTYRIKKGTPHKVEALEDCVTVVEFDCFN